MKTVVLGAGGQLGRDLCVRLEGEVVPLMHSQADLTQAQQLRATLFNVRPDVICNCAAYNFVDRAENEPDAAFAVNCWGVRNLAEVCRDLDCTLVQFSTDYVFGLDSNRRAPYLVSDAPGPLSVYGISKLAGEYCARAIAPRHFVIRTCGLYGVSGMGGKGGNFVETMLRAAGQGKPLRVVADQQCTPTYSADLAAAVPQLVRTQNYGMHHMTNSGSCSWLDFACAIFELAGLKADVTPISSSDWKAAARRPAYSVLDCQLPMRPWREALADYLRCRASGVNLTPVS